MFRKERLEHAFKTFTKDIKAEDMPPVIFMYGEEGYLIDWAVETITARYVNEACKALDYIKFQEDTVDADIVLEACETFSMISERRVVWANEYLPLKSVNAKGFTKEDVKRIEAYLKEPSEGTILIFSAQNPEPKSELVKLLKAECKCYNFEQLDYAALSGFINKRFLSAGVQVSRDIIKVIIDQSGYFNKETEYRLYNLINDIEKIIAYSSGQIIDEDAVSQVLNGDMDKFIFNLLDAVSNNQKDKAFNLLANILRSGKDIFSITAMLINQFELMLEVAEFKEEGMNLPQITKILKSSEFRIKKAMGFTEIFTVGKLKSILSQLYEVDRNIKTGMLEPELALELLIGRI